MTTTIPIPDIESQLQALRINILDIKYYPSEGWWVILYEYPCGGHWVKGGGCWGGPLRAALEAVAGTATRVREGAGE